MPDFIGMFEELQAPQPAPILTAPSIAGTIASGNSLTLTSGTYAGTPAPTLTYDILRSGVAIGGQTGLTKTQAQAYVEVGADEGVLISVKEYATAIGGITTQNSNTLESVPHALTAPSIAGTVAVGNSLTITAGTYRSASAVVLTYDIQRDGVAIGGQTGLTKTQAQAYLEVSDDMGTAITVKEYATNATGTSNQTSNALTTAPFALTVPSIAGTVGVGNSITVTSGTYRSTSSVTLTYDILRAGVAIGGQTGLTKTQAQAYVESAPDVGPSLTVVEHATNASGATTQTSNAITYNAATDTSWVFLINPALIAVDGSNHFTTFTDVMGNTVTVDAGTGTVAPTGFNGTPGLTFNGSTRLKVAGAGATMAAINKGTQLTPMVDAMAGVASVVEYTINATSSGFGYLRNDSGPLEGLVNATNWRFVTLANAGNGGLSPVVTPALIEVDVDRSVSFGISRIARNGVSLTMTDHGTGAVPGGNFANDNFYIGNRGSGGLPWTGTMGAVGFANPASANALATCRAYLNFLSGSIF